MKDIISFNIESINKLISSFLYLPIIIFPYFLIKDFMINFSFILSVIFFILIGMKIAFVNVIRYKSKGDENKEDKEMSKHPFLIFMQFFVFIFSVISLIMSIYYYYQTEDVAGLIFILIIISGISYFITGIILIWDRIIKNTKNVLYNIKRQNTFRGESI